MGKGERMPTYVIRRSEGQRTPLSDVMQGLPPMPAEVRSHAYETKVGGASGPVRSQLRKQLEAMAVGDQIETVERTPSQVQAIAFHVRRVIPEARYSARNAGTFTRIRRIA
jgi:hypothetical protein